MFTNDVTRSQTPSFCARLELAILITALLLAPVAYLQCAAQKDVAYAANGQSVNAYFYIRTDGVVPYGSIYQSDAFTPRGDHLKALQGQLREPLSCAYDPDAVSDNIKRTPPITTIEVALFTVGISYDSKAQKIIWYAEEPLGDGSGDYRVMGLVAPNGSHMLRYVSDPGTSGVPPARPVLDGDVIDLPKAPSREGHVFLGWDTSPGASKPEYKSGTAFTMPSSNTTLYAIWTDSNVEVSFMAVPNDGGTLTRSSESINVESAKGLVDVKATPEDGYDFVGWFKGDVPIGTDPVLSYGLAKRNLNSANGLYDQTTFIAKFKKRKADSGNQDTPSGNGGTGKVEDPSNDNKGGSSSGPAASKKDRNDSKGESPKGASDKSDQASKRTKDAVAGVLQKTGDDRSGAIAILAFVIAASSAILVCAQSRRRVSKKGERSHF